MTGDVIRELALMREFGFTDLGPTFAVVATPRHDYTSSPPTLSQGSDDDFTLEVSW
jgi:hypothetical protein